MSDVVKVNGQVDNTYIIGKEDFKHSRKPSYANDDDDLGILTDKGVYPYGYMNNWDKFNDTELPKKRIL